MDSRRIQSISFEEMDSFIRDVRAPMTIGFYKELSFFASKERELLGMVIKDKIDNDYSWMIFARDENKKFRCCEEETFIVSQEQAESQLCAKMENVLATQNIEKYGEQA